MFNRGAHPEREELLSLLLEEEEEDDELLEEEEVPSSSSPLCASSSASAAKSGRSLRICTAGIFDESQMPINVAITPQQDTLLSKGVWHRSLVARAVRHAIHNQRHSWDNLHMKLKWVQAVKGTIFFTAECSQQDTD